MAGTDPDSEPSGVDLSRFVMSKDDIELGDVDPTYAAVGAIDSAMTPIPTKVVCWGAAEGDAFPPDGDPTAYVGKTYRAQGYTIVNTDRSNITPPEGGRLLAVVLPEGTMGVFDKDTHELIVARNQTFRVVSIRPDGAVKVVAVLDEEEGN